MTSLLPPSRYALSTVCCVFVLTLLACSGCDNRQEMDQEKLPKSNTSEFQTILKEFVDSQDAEIFEQNRVIQAEFQRIRGETASYADKTDALQDEAIELLALYKDASPEDRRIIEQRVEKVVSELKRLEQDYPLNFGQD